MKTDINTILKSGSGTKVETIDYSTKKKLKELKVVKKKSEIAKRNFRPHDTH